MEIKYTNTNGIETSNGSQIKIIDTKTSGNIYTYSCISMTIQFHLETIVITGIKELKTIDSDNIYKESFELYVTNNTYRRLSDTQVVTKEEAVDETGLVKSGYEGEFKFFVDLFGHNIYNQPLAIYPFIAQAIICKFN